MFFLYAICVFAAFMGFVTPNVIKKPYSFGMEILEDITTPNVIKNEDSIRIRCQYFNKTLCEESPEECEGAHTCEGGPSSQCFALWSNTTAGSVEVIYKGCFISNSECSEQDICVEKGEPKDSKKLYPSKRGGLLFCCCEKDLCNQEVIWDPTPPPPTLPPATVKENESSQDIAYFAAYVIFPISMVILLVVMFWLKRGKSSYLSSASSTDLRTGSLPSPVQSEKLRVVQLLEIKASGKFGDVWKATYDNRVVAVKVIPFQEKQSWQTEQEIFQLPKMDHENILQFIGAEKRGDNLTTELWLITDYHELGSLHDFLAVNVVSWEELCRIGFTMARGLSYLHEEIPAQRKEDYKPAIAHRDFKSNNVLLKRNLTACIADFGLALVFRSGQPCGATHGQVGTRRYMAPEVLEGAINFTVDLFLRIDMYACGLVLWEIMSRCTSQPSPIGRYQLPFEEDVGQYPSLDDMQDVVVHRKKRPHIPDSWRKHPEYSVLCETIEECWDTDPEARLSAACVMDRITWCSESNSATAQLLHNSSN